MISPVVRPRNTRTPASYRTGENVWPWPGEPRLGLASPFDHDRATAELLGRRFSDAEAYLERAAAPHREGGFDVRTRVVAHADPATAVLNEAHALGCDFIALRSHGRTELSRLVHGSVADAVARHAETQILALVGFRVAKPSK